MQPVKCYMPIMNTKKGYEQFFRMVYEEDCLLGLQLFDGEVSDRRIFDEAALDLAKEPSDAKSAAVINAVCDNEHEISKSRRTNFAERVCQELTEYMSGERTSFSIRFKMCGTSFQKKVWSALLEIPYGKTATYQEIAVNVGNPKAARAVGMACNRNPLMIVVPCHRVIGANGKLTGYAGGLEMKMRLLELEKDAANRDVI